MGTSILVMARLSTVVADGRATLPLRLLPWLLPWVLLLLVRWLPVLFIYVAIQLPVFDSTPLPLPIYESLASGRGDY